MYQRAAVKPVVGEVLHSIQPRYNQSKVEIDSGFEVGFDGEPQGHIIVESSPQGVNLLAETVARGAVIAVEVAVVDIVLVFQLVVETESELVLGIVQCETAVGEVVEAVIHSRHPAQSFGRTFLGDDIDDAAGALRIVGGIGILDDVDARHIGRRDGVDGAEVRGYAVEEQQHIAVAS